MAAAPYLYSGPSPTASLATVLAGFRVNEAEGDELRQALCQRRPARVLDRIDELGLRTLNTSGCPIIELPLGDADDIDAVGRFLFDRGIYVTLAAYPLVPKSQVGFRIQVTAANADDEIEQLNDVLGELAERFDMQRRSRPPLTAMARAVQLTAPLRRRDFRLLWTGMSVSLLGDGIFLVAVAWVGLRLSDRPSSLAYVGLALSLPQVVMLLVGGAVSDRASPAGPVLGRLRPGRWPSARWPRSPHGRLLHLWELYLAGAVARRGHRLRRARLRRPGAPTGARRRARPGQRHRAVRPARRHPAGRPGPGRARRGHRRPGRGLALDAC